MYNFLLFSALKSQNQVSFILDNEVAYPLNAYFILSFVLLFKFGKHCSINKNQQTIYCV